MQQKTLAFLGKSDRINVNLFLRCGQMFAEKRRVFLCKDAERSMISAKGKHAEAKNNKRRDRI